MKILVGDDDHTTVKLIKSALEGAGHQVLVAFDGMQTVRLARLERPDLIILDIVMPGQDGTVVAGNLARIPDTMAIPFIFLSSQSPEEATWRGDVSHARAYLQKPIKVKLLLAEVQRVMTNPQATSADEVIGIDFGASLDQGAPPPSPTEPPVQFPDQSPPAA